MPAARRLTPRGKERRDQILAFATAKFAEQGYHPTSVAEIVAGIGVGKGVFYWYFESKEVLFVEILRSAQKDMRRRQQHAVRDLADPVEQIAMGIRAAVHWLAEHRDLFTLFEFAQTDDRFAQLVRRGRAELASDAVPYLKAAITNGQIPDADPDQLAHAVLGVSSYLTMVFLHERGQSPERVAEAAVDFCLHGIGAA